MDRSRLRGALAELARRRAASPLDYFRWLVPQDRWLRLPGDKLYRAGNQALGKSTAALAEVIWRCLGTHPYYATKAPPIEVIVCSLNQAQSISIQGKFHALLPADVLDPECEYNVKTGFGANRPMTRFRNGSTIRWVTDDQGPRAVAGATVDVVLVDEPCSPEMMRELRKRLLVKAGVLLMSLTPINGPVEHIRAAVESGLIPEVHAELTEANLRHVDTGEIRTLEDGTVCDDAWIAEMWRKEPAIWAGITLNGLWEVRPEGAYFAPVWDAAKHVSDRARLDGETRWHLGIDYAAADRPQGLVAVLALVESSKSETGHAVESVIVEDMVSLPGTATVTMFAQDIIRMLARNGLQWRHLRTVYGDNPVQGRHEYKGNYDLTRRLAHELKIAQNGLSPRIMGAKEKMRGGSRDTGCRYLYEAMASGRLVVRSRCAPLVEAIETWDYTVAHPAKDRVDALRYALKDYVFPIGRVNYATVRVA
jgi:hypothetical protein